MPGCVGLIQADPDQHVSKLFSALLAPMDRGGRLLTERRVDAAGQWGLGRVHLGVFQRDPQLDRESAIQVLVHGELFNEAKLASEIGDGGVKGGGRGAAPFLRKLYEVHGQQCFSRLEGTFSAVILDSKAKKIILAMLWLGVLGQLLTSYSSASKRAGLFVNFSLSWFSSLWLDWIFSEKAC